MKHLRVAIAALAPALLSVACGVEPPVPAEPTWVDDVEPILRGNCFSCHGAGKRSTDAHRWDFFYDQADPALKQVVVPKDLVENRVEAAKWPVWLTLPTGDFMPPPPAPRLTDRDVEVFRRFALNPRRGMRVANQPPRLAWYPKAPWILVSDGDHEQVLGKLVCGGAEVPIDHTGAQPLPAGANPPCAGTLTDGQDAVSVTLE